MLGPVSPPEDRTRSMWTKMSRFSRRLTAAVGVSAMVLCTAPCAAADPADGAGVDAATLSLTDLGASPTLSFYGETSSTTLSFPVPQGAVPVALNTTVSLPFAMRSGLLTVTQGDRLISKVGLPLTDMAPLVIPLPGVQVVNDLVSVNLRLADLADDRYCLDNRTPVELINGSVTFAGREAPPTTVADFLPAIARKLTIAVPGKPSQAESDAAVRLATDLDNPLPRSVSRGSRRAPRRRCDRHRRPVSGARASVRHQRGGRGRTRPRGFRTVSRNCSSPVRPTSSSTRCGFSPTALSAWRSAAGLLRDRCTAESMFPGNSATLAELGERSPDWPATVNIALDQTRFGHSARVTGCT